MGNVQGNFSRLLKELQAYEEPYDALLFMLDLGNRVIPEDELNVLQMLIRGEINGIPFISFLAIIAPY